MLQIGDKVRLNEKVLEISPKSNLQKVYEITDIYTMDNAPLYELNNKNMYRDKYLTKIKVETNFEHYIDRIAICIGNNCDDYFGCGDECCNCPFGDTEKIKEWLLSPCEEPKIELFKWEYDLLTTIEEQRFDFNQRNMKMKEKGYFKGINDTKMRIKEILERSVIVDE